MAIFVDQDQSHAKRTRKRHQKSRNGCFECKRRRVKCDEAKPSCERCALLQDKCVYPSAPQRSSSSVVLLPSPDPSSCLEQSPSFAVARSSPSRSVTYCSNSPAETLEPITDAALYHHYLQHTSRTLTPGQRDQSALQINLPEMARENKTIFHSMLAISAACMCCDMIEKEPKTSTSAVNQVLMVGYQHYNLASEQMRGSISRPDTLKPDDLLASAVLLVPFATASQRINHWISRRSQNKGSNKLLSTTPRDAMILMRGIRTTLRTLYCNTLVSSSKSGKESVVSTYSPSADSNISSDLPQSRTHAMFAIVATTSQNAFTKLQERLDSASFHCSKGYADGLSACKAAFKTLDCLRARAFSPAEKTLESGSASLLPMPPWLRSFASRAADPLPHETLTSFFLSFLVQVPQGYLDLLLPLLDQRLESRIGVSWKASPVIRLTTIQVLALDIYAHWSVLMFLVEDYSWWIGDLPEVTLAGMVSTYGANLATRLVPESDSELEKWWPAGMLNILREIKRFR